LKRKVEFYAGTAAVNIPRWMDQIKRMCEFEGLLCPDPAMMRKLAELGLVWIAVNAANHNKVVGFLFLRPCEECGCLDHEWLELGPFCVLERYRRHERGGPAVSSSLLEEALEANRAKNVVGDKHPSIAKVSRQFGMLEVPTVDLPECLRRQNDKAPQRIVSAETWIRLKCLDAPSTEDANKRIRSIPHYSKTGSPPA